MSVYAFVFARGGSKGLKGKNIRLLEGKPLIQYSIDLAKASSIVDEIFVSTDCSEISAVAKELGAIVIERPAELASDNAPEWLAWQHAVNWVQDRYGTFSTFLSLPATSPLREEIDIDNAVSKLNSSDKFDICIGVTPSSRSPYFNMVKINESETVELLISPKDGAKVHRRQDTVTSYDITTLVYATRPSYILSNNGLFDGNVTSIEVPRERSVDIDDIYDFNIANMLIKNKEKTSC